MNYLCTVCEHVYTDADLEDAVQITGGRGSGRSRHPTTYQFADGSFHFLRRVKTKKQPQTPTSVVPEPKEDTELLQQVVSALAELPTPTPPMPGPELKPLPQIEESEEQNTAMAFAFRRAKGNQYAET